MYNLLQKLKDYASEDFFNGKTTIEYYLELEKYLTNKEKLFTICLN